MAGEWKTTKLGNIAIINPDIITKDWPYTYIQYIDISSVGEGLIQTAPLRLELSKAPSRAKRLVRPGDTVLSTVRPNRRSMFYVNKPADDWVVSTGFAVLRPDEQRIHPRFLYCCVFNQAFTDYLITREKGAAYPAVSPEDIANVEIPLPSLTHQRAIACILGALDDKIELNRRMNETLEQIAQAIFKKWFIEPTKNGKLPEGWREGTLGDIAGLIGGYAFKSKDWIEDGVPVVKIGSVKRGIVDLREVSFVSIDVAEQARRFRLDVGDFLISMTGYVGEVGLVPPTENLPLLNQRVGKFVLEKPGTSRLGFLYCFTRRPEFKSQVEQKSHGTAQANVSVQGILSIPIILPPKRLKEEFDAFCEPILNRILRIHADIQTLSALRDTLLPKLISGELRVPDAEKICARGASALGGMERCV